MAKVIVKIKALPRDVSDNIDELKVKVKDFLAKHGAVYKVEVQPFAFGLNIILVTLVMEESEGTSKLEAEFLKFKPAEMSIVDMSRAPDF